MSGLNRRTAIVAVAAVAILLGAGLAAAKATFTPVSITAWQAGPPSGGDVKCVGGTATGTWPPCTLGGKYQARGRVSTIRQVSPDPLHTGTRTLIFNVNLDENGQGHMWGTWVVVLDGGRGEWEGTFTGSAYGWFGAADGDVVGHGTEGEVGGMQLRLVFSYETFPGVETDTGYRFDPKGAK